MPTKPSVPTLPSQSTARLQQSGASADNSRVAQYNPALRSLFEAGGEIKIKTKGRGRGGEQMVRLSNPGALKAFKKYETTVATDIEAAFSLTFPTQKGDFTFAEICKPHTKGNMGDVAEGVFAAAIGARFIKKRNREANIAPTDVHAIITLLRNKRASKISGKKGMEVFIEVETPNYGLPRIKDTVKVYVSLSEGNMKYFLDSTNISAMSGLITASCKFANEANVKWWANTIYRNERKDFLEIEAMGLKGQKATKIDVQVTCTDEKGIPYRIPDLQVSLKAGDTAQFGQKGGNNWGHRKATKGPPRLPEAKGYDWFFSTLFCIDINEVWNETAYEEMKARPNKVGPLGGTYDAIDLLWSGVTLKIAEKIININSPLDQKICKNFFTHLGKGIQYFARLDDPYVSMVHLNNNDARIYKFNDLPELLSKDLWKWEVKYSTGTTKEGYKLPKIEIIETGTRPQSTHNIVNRDNDKEDRGDKTLLELAKEDEDNLAKLFPGPGGQLLVIRIKTENRANGTKYFRNYVEKGPFLGELIAHATKGNIGD